MAITGMGTTRPRTTLSVRGNEFPTRSIGLRTTRKSARICPMRRRADALPKEAGASTRHLPSAAYSCHGSRTWGSDSEPTIVKLTHTAPTFGSDRGPRGDRRIRSTACVTVPRLGVRPVLWPRGFPSVTGLGSSNSAAARYRLVRCLHRYYAGVRLLRALHHRLTASRLPDPDAVPPVAR